MPSPDQIAVMNQALHPWLRGISALRRVEFLQILPLLVLAYTVLMPLEMRVSLAQQNIYPYRAAIILLSPWYIYQIASGHLRLHFADGLIFAGCSWIIISMMAVYMPLDGFLRGAAAAMDIIAPYLAGRICIKNLSDLRRFLIFFAPGVGLVSAAILLESIAGVPLVRPGFAQIFGPLPAYFGGEELSDPAFAPTYRFGFLRAAASLSHPILAGLFLASLLPLYSLSKIRGWPLWLGMASSLFAILSWSSAAFFGLIISAGLMAYDWLQKRVEFLSWKLAAYLGILAGLVLEFASQSGLIRLIVRLTFNPQTGYYRLLIWEFGTESIRQHPLFGIGYAAYERYEWMNDSIDAHWLLLGVRHGLITPIVLFAACILAIALAANAAPRHGDTDRQAIMGVAIALLMLTLLGFTVAFFGGLMIWYFALVGMAISLAQIGPAIAAPAIARPIAAPGQPSSPG